MRNAKLRRVNKTIFAVVYVSQTCVLVKFETVTVTHKAVILKAIVIVNDSGKTSHANLIGY